VRLEGRAVLLTGATGGIGNAIARALAARGATLVLSGRRVDVLEPLAAELGARALVADLADRSAVETLAAEAGDIDVLVANAGVPASGALLEYSPEQIDRALDVNLRAPIQLARALLVGMVARGRGHLVLMSSTNGKIATPYTSVYCATKFGLRGFAQSMREDLRDQGIGVSTVSPGFIREAGMFADAGVAPPRVLGSRTPEDVAAAVVDAIEHDRADIDVAPLFVRLSGRLAGAAPGLVAAVQRRGGAATIAERVARGQAAKR
jgi:short-subunit dehydrogenase